MTDNRTNGPTPEQIEAAAKAAYEFDADVSELFGRGLTRDFDGMPQWAKDTHLDKARAALVAAQEAAPQAGRKPKRLLNQLNRIADALEDYEFEGIAADAPTWIRKSAEYIESGRQWRAPVLPSSGVDEEKLARLLCEKNYLSPDGEPTCAACRDKAHEVAEWLKGRGLSE